MKIAPTAKALFAGVALLTGACAHPLAAQPSGPANAEVAEHKPRNIIFILIDDLRFDGMGFLQPQLQTPAIDRLARGGTYMPNTLVTSSLCSPSRATILTGMTARNHGIVDNTDSSEEGLTFFPAYLQEAGYSTAFIGKWHMGSATDAPRAGFDKWVSFKGQGEYYPNPDAAPGRETNFNVDGVEVPQRGYITDELTDYAMNWLEHERDPDQPFMLYLSHKAVHSDPLPPPRYAGQYDNVTFDLPASSANTPENYEGKPMWVYNQRNTWHGLDFFYNSDMSMQEYLRYYYSTLSAVDDSVARILAYLEANDLEDDTLVVFTSDNGYLIGDHGLIDKRNAYQPSVQVPMVVYAPGAVPAGAVNPGRIRNLDFAPTFLSLAGVDLPPQFEGHNAWPLMSGAIPTDQWQPDDFIYEYYWEWTFPMTPGTFAIVRDNLKYIQYYGIYDTEELYDLAQDPEEMHNLIEDPDFLEAKVAMRQALFDQLADDDGRHVIPYTRRYSRGSVRRMEGGTRAADFPNSWYVEPNRIDRLDDIFPDSPAKLEAHTRGKALAEFPVLGTGSNTVESASEALEE
ncbi:sulfatase family protein [Aurantiacibacter flavus]|uniref:Sulfatase n=1 Tax=Aurantiacibacter flavus TaxID=3145232 RepID=A0ABV0CRV0_9SPHN